MFLGMAVYVVKKEYKAKIDCGYKFYEGDYQATTKNVVMLALVAFAGSFSCTFTGVGPAAFYNPTMLTIGMHP